MAEQLWLPFDTKPLIEPWRVPIPVHHPWTARRRVRRLWKIYVDRGVFEREDPDAEVVRSLALC